MAETKTIDLIPEYEPKVYHASSGDINRSIRVDLVEGLSTLTLTGSETLILNCKLPNGNKHQQVIPSTSGSYIDIDLDEEITALEGFVYCKLKISGLGCKAFLIYVEVNV